MRWCASSVKCRDRRATDLAHQLVSEAVLRQIPHRHPLGAAQVCCQPSILFLLQTDRSLGASVEANLRQSRWRFAKRSRPGPNISLTKFQTERLIVADLPKPEPAAPASRRVSASTLPAVEKNSSRCCSCLGHTRCSPTARPCCAHCRGSRQSSWHTT